MHRRAICWFCAVSISSFAKINRINSFVKFNSFIYANSTINYDDELSNKTQINNSFIFFFLKKNYFHWFFISFQISSISMSIILIRYFFQLYFYCGLNFSIHLPLIFLSSSFLIEMAKIHWYRRMRSFIIESILSKACLCSIFCFTSQHYPTKRIA